MGLPVSFAAGQLYLEREKDGKCIFCLPYPFLQNGKNPPRLFYSLERCFFILSRLGMNGLDPLLSDTEKSAVKT